VHAGFVKYDNPRVLKRQFINIRMVRVIADLIDNMIESFRMETGGRFVEYREGDEFLHLRSQRGAVVRSPCFGGGQGCEERYAGLPQEDSLSALGTCSPAPHQGIILGSIKKHIQPVSQLQFTKRQVLRL